MSEFGLINHIKMLFGNIDSNNFEGIGDDCAIFDLGEDQSLVFTTDMLVEDVHFLRQGGSAFDLGYKSLAVNLSDVAAMGARPIASLLSLSVPKELMGEWIEEFMDGYHALSQKYSTALIGGDTTASKDRLTINVTAIGIAKKSQLKRRSDARAGDIILVNGSLGESGDGLQSILNGDNSTPNAKIHMKPEPQVAAGQWLGARDDVHAMMDISDGIASDLHHIMDQSGVGAQIELTQVPTSVDIKTAITAGEDYMLLFTAAPQNIEKLLTDYQTEFGSKLYPIGKITESGKIEWLENGITQDADYMGFRHY